ncbi:MAG: hypothetical protein ONB46_07300 [candidate division KSB1 bacterium]|nr:hypothetical protein [candidate division KSB1 bacterium]MDZ7365586.1 hypothetical protein [candidate division KSB1 bacterium]MDZ7403688.1 hypothetical protein [candidate division KSB1 bacterium]
MPYRIEYSPEAEDQIRARTARQRAIILNTMDKQLLCQTTVEDDDKNLDFRGVV